MVTHHTRTPFDDTGTPVVIDVDSILWDFMRPIAGWTGIPYERLVARWDSIRDEVDHAHIPQLFMRAFSLRAMRDQGPLPGAVESVERLAGKGRRIILMTDRPTETAEDLIIWLADNGVPWHELRCGSGCKVEVATERGLRVIVDDKPATLERAHGAGMHALTLTYPYNREVVERLGLRAAESWKGLAPQIDEVLATMDDAQPSARALPHE